MGEDQVIISDESPCLISHYAKGQKVRMGLLLDFFQNVFVPCNHIQTTINSFPSGNYQHVKEEFIFMKWCPTHD